MRKIIIFSFAILLVLNASARQLQSSTGYGGSSSGGGSSGGGSSTYSGGSTPSYGGSTPSYGGSTPSYGGTTPPYEEEYHEETYHHEETYEETYHHEETYEETYHHEETYETPTYGGGSKGSYNYGGYAGYTPPYEEEYANNQSYYGGYGSKPTYHTTEENYETPSYGYGGTPTYNNAANSTYTSEYEETYTGGYEESNGKPSIPFVPTSLLTGFVVDIHFLAVDTRFQYIAYHYCSDLYPGYTQCDIYNGTSSDSRMVATEIVVSAEIFAQLPMEERKLWHSHAFAVKSGILVSPNTPADQDLAVMSSVQNSYGKITDFWHSWQNFPYGGAKLAYGLADASQINATLADEMDKALGLSTTWRERAAARKNLNPTIIPGADDYLTSGQFPQYITQMFPVAGATSGSTGATSESGETAGATAEEGSTVGGAASGESGENGSITVFPEEAGETSSSGSSSSSGGSRGSSSASGGGSGGR